MIKVLLIFLFFVGCSAQECKIYYYQDQFNYKVNPALLTPSGIQVDPTNQTVSLTEIDKQTQEVEDCLSQLFDGKLDEETIKESDCLENSFILPIQRECISVKIPDDWFWNRDNTQQLLPSLAPDELCRDKGLEPPCYWRAGIQDQLTIVVTPDLFLYKDPLIRIVTGCNNPWKGRLLKCTTNF